MDVKKLGRIFDDGGWRARGRLAANQNGRENERVGYDYIHSVVDDHGRLAYSEIHPDEKADTTAAFFARALEFFVAAGITNVERVMTDNRIQLPARPAPTPTPRRAQHPPQVHPPALPLAERQSGALQPHPRH